MRVVMTKGPHTGPFSWDTYDKVKRRTYPGKDETRNYVAGVDGYNDIMENVKILCEARWGGG